MSAESLLHVRAAVQRWRLPFNHRRWSGGSGGLAGRGTGSSLEFEEHRGYFPGDDLRHIDWNAYARTGHPLTKVFRDEVRPFVDIAVDLSASMKLTSEKAARTLQLVLWTMESANVVAASLRLWGCSEGGLLPLDISPLLTLSFSGAAPQFDDVPWRSGALRVLISDLLWPGDPARLLDSFGRSAGLAMVLSPFSSEESNPDWDGNCELSDSETGERRLQHIDTEVRNAYRKAYEAHFSVWDEECLRRRILFARVPDAGAFTEVLESRIYPVGAAEMVA